MKIKAVIESIGDTANVTSSFKRRNFIVKYWNNPDHVEFLSFECIQDRCDLLDSFKIGDTVSISFNLKGKKWTNSEGQNRYFNTLQVWNLELDVGTVCN